MTHRILIADDDPSIRFILSRLLGRLGYSVMSVANGQEASAAIAESQPDLVFLDIMMPEWDGYYTCKHLREQGFPGFIIMMSAVPADEAYQRAKAHGADDFLQKPISYDVLERCITDLFSLFPS